ncbi:MAG TPA: CobD/CbiB family cobalamin biosynthesis protein [Egibacteraceae bacterium]|nr:CobD/CbiB family cobalamin biosynthesis protein [Egibacteraceae bacterium]
MSAAPALAVGWAADAAVGDPRRFHPVAGFGAAAARVEGRWWRDSRAAGTTYAGMLVGAPTVAVWALDRWARRRGAVPAGLLTAAVVWAATGGRSLAAAGRRLAGALDRDDLPAAREILPSLCGRDPSGLDAKALAQAGVESLAENTADAVTGPLVWGALAGPAGAVAHRCANTLDAMVGHRSPRHARFGWAAARLDDALGWLPARVTTVLLAALAPAVGGSARAAWATARRDGGRHPSPNAGRCEAAMAGGLGVRLGGTIRYGDGQGGPAPRAAGGTELRGPFGHGPPPGPADVRRAVRLSRLAGAAAAALASTASLAATAPWRQR